MTDYTFQVDLYRRVPGGQIVLARNGSARITQTVGGLAAPDLKQNGQPVAQVQADANGRAVFTSSAFDVTITETATGYARRLVSPDAQAEAIASGPSIAFDEDGRPYFNAAGIPAAGNQDAAVAAQVQGGEQTRAALNAWLGGDATGLVTAVAGKVGKGDLVLNVKDYGAKGDGTTNDAPAIQAALNAATPGTTVRIPRGTYRIAQEMQLTVSGVTIDATGATLCADWGGTGSGDFVMLANGKAGDAPTGYTGVGGITLVGGIWDARGHVNNVSYSSPFAFAHAHGVTLRDVTLRNVRRGHGIDLTACRSAKFIGCRFEGYTDTGSPRLTEAIQVDLASSSSTFPRFGAYDSTPCDDVAVIGCSFTDSADCGPWPRAVGSHNARTDKQMTNVRVQGCYMKVTDGAVRAYNWSRFAITGNVIEGGPIQVFAINAATPGEDTKNGAGEQTNASAPIAGGTIGNNVVQGSAGDGIAVLGYVGSGVISGVTVSGNVLRAPTATGARWGIHLSTVDGCTVVGNRVSSAPAESIRVDASSTNVVISSNTISGGGSHGVMVDTSTGCLVTDNHVSNAGGHGISLSGTGSADNTVRGNSIIGASAAIANCQGIRVGGNTNSAVTGNIVRAGTTAPQYALQISNTCTGIVRYGNDFRGAGTSGAVDDSGAGTITSPADLTA